MKSENENSSGEIFPTISGDSGMYGKGFGLWWSKFWQILRFEP